MIVDKLKNCELYYGLNPGIDKALKYLKNNDLKAMENGTYYIDGSNLYMSISEYETKSRDNGLWEAHKRYIDIQYIIQGVEKMGYTDVEHIKTTIEYDENKDILFGEGDGDFISVPEGSFAIFMPQHAHMPGLYVDESKPVRKAVFKILI